MNRPEKKLAGLAKWAIVGAFTLGGFGCELIASVDRDKIQGSGGSGGSGGAAPECAAPAGCPDTGNECVTRTCDGGKCGTSPVAAMTPLAAQTAGDCKLKQCDGAGKTTEANDDLDFSDDKNACTDDKCIGGAVTNNPSAAGTACGTGSICNGTGACVGCVDAADCPGQDDECEKRSCTVGTCGFTFTSAGTKITTQTAGDCVSNECNGTGSVQSTLDNTDLPVDGNECTDDICTGGVASNPPTAAGGVCTTPGGTVCNGSSSCVACLFASTCPGVDNECQTRTCAAGACGIAFVPADTPAATQAAGDCKVNKCDGAGVSNPTNDNADVPDDSNPCTNDVCTAGIGLHTSAPSGTACGASLVCNAVGVCVGCVVANNCPGQDTDCQVRSCTLNVCGVANTSAGTATSMQIVGNCKKNTCNGSGGVVAANDSTDLPVDGVQCTSDVCTNGVPSNPPASSGAVCSQMGGTVCSGAGTCVQCFVGTDCPSGVCTANVCQAPSCTDGVKNGVETGQDCGGGTCPSCALGLGCMVASDCAGGICTINVCSQVNGCDLSNATNLTGGAPVTVTFANGNFTYAPKCIKVTVATVLTFNGNFAGHPMVGGEVVAGAKVQASTGPFLPATSSGSTASFTMSATGTFPYYCEPHALGGMTGAVFVVP